MRTLTCLITWLTVSAAHAHEGHGLGGGHWHASDAWGPIAIAALAIVWLSRK